MAIIKGWIILLSFAFFSAADVFVASRDDLMKLRVKKLRLFLQERGITCKGCNEKEHFVARAKEVFDMPVLLKEQEHKEDGETLPKTQKQDSRQENEDTNASKGDKDDGKDEQREEQQEEVEQKDEKDNTSDKKTETKTETKKKDKQKGKKQKDKKKDQKKKDKKKTKKKKAKAAPKTVGDVWGKQAEKICSKLTQPTVQTEPSACEVFGVAVKNDFDRFAGIFLNAGLFNGLGDLGGAGGLGGGSATTLKKTAMQQPYRKAGLYLLRKAARLAIEESQNGPQRQDSASRMAELLHPSPQRATTSTDLPDNDSAEGVNEPAGTDDVKEVTAELEEDSEGAEGDTTEKTPKSLDERIGDIVSSTMNSWLFDTAMKNPSKMDSYSSDYEDILKNFRDQGTSSDEPSLTPKPTPKPTPRTAPKSSPPSPPSYKPKARSRQFEEEEEEDVIDLDDESNDYHEEL